MPRMTPVSQRLAIVAAVAVTISAGRFAPLSAQTPASPAADTAATTLIIGGDVATPLTLTPAEIKTMPRTTVTVREGTAKLRGVPAGEPRSAPAPQSGDSPARRSRPTSAPARRRLPGRFRSPNSIQPSPPTRSSCRHRRRVVPPRSRTAVNRGAARPHASRWVRMLQRIDVVRLANDLVARCERFPTTTSSIHVPERA